MNGASSYAGLVDRAFIFILGTSVLLLVGVTAVMIGFIIRYRRSKNPNPAQIEGSATLETIWTVLPTILVLVMFYYGWAGFKVMRDIPDGAEQVTVKAKKWSWLFEYENGKESTELMVPVGRPVALNLTSSDVIHSFFVPAFRLKEDCVPGRTNHAWFEAIRPGRFDLLCAEYCGDQHSAMLSKVVAVPADSFDAWLGLDSGPPTGRQLLDLRGCAACHTIDGKKLVGPSFKGVFGEKVTVMTDGVERTIEVDEDYLRRSILNPKADLVGGYEDKMPEQRDLVTDEEVEAIIKFIKGLR
ncbi:cytochrome c oxidase subunit II [bacterium]|nr:cytochrome c oxidase subunit II [bacterium]PJA76334.1 MAG: cytochrome c oxidase subunit II [bacterium CG_4_9_14_3_um_filter_65_15]